MRLVKKTEDCLVFVHIFTERLDTHDLYANIIGLFQVTCNFLIWERGFYLFIFIHGTLRERIIESRTLVQK